MWLLQTGRHKYAQYLPTCFRFLMTTLQQLCAIAEREKDPNAALRITVESGGCHGYQYKMELAKSRSEDD